MPEKFKNTKSYLRLVAVIIDLMTVNLSINIVTMLLGEYGYNDLSDSQYWSLFAIFNIAYIPIYFLFEIHRYHRIVLDEIVIERCLYTIITHVLAVLAIVFFTSLPMPPRSMVMGYFFIAFILIGVERLLFRHIVFNYSHDGSKKIGAVIIGESKASSKLKDVMLSPSYSYEVSTLNNGDNYIDWLENHKDIVEVYSALPSTDEKDITEIYRYCEKHMMHFYAISNYQGLINHSMSISYIGDVAVLSPRREPLRKMSNKIIKRIFDFILSSIYLCTIHPFIYIIFGSLIKLSSKGPVYFKQARSGMNGETFYILKFRSMCVNDKADELQATAHDARKTWIGDFMRRTNIDELPQFINVWKGDMSIVGPRPHMLKHTEEYSKLIDEYMVRHFVKPGITGWAQITGFRGETPKLSDMEGRVRQDIWYIENWSFWLDLKIIFITFFDTIIGEKRGA